MNAATIYVAHGTIINRRKRRMPFATLFMFPLVIANCVSHGPSITVGDTEPPNALPKHTYAYQESRRYRTLFAAEHQAPVPTDSIRRSLLSAIGLCKESDYDSVTTLLRRCVGELRSSMYTDRIDIERELLFGATLRLHAHVVFAETFTSAVPDSIRELLNNDLKTVKERLSPQPDKEPSAWNLYAYDTVSTDLEIPHNDRVAAALKRFLSYKKRVIERWLERASYYLPLLKREFAKNGLPTDLAYLPLLESGFRLKAYSPAHAAGLWQFIPATGKRFGLRQNRYIDERYDPLKATGAAIAYLRVLYKMFGDWDLALAAYNCGEGRVSKTLTRSGATSYWDIQLPRETMNYVPQFYALVLLAKNASLYGIHSQPHETGFDLDTLYVTRRTSLRTISGKTGVNLELLQSLNPHILRNEIPEARLPVLLYLPRGRRRILKALRRRMLRDRFAEGYVSSHRLHLHSIFTFFREFSGVYGKDRLKIPYSGTNALGAYKWAPQWVIPQTPLEPT
ncbi:MAG: transglycosylase SLT domain-containing protein [Chitinivibrionales bacterium]|nr:transglycosylase SLT domain-containing protein [Chitinivibrionales bacterium]MBD3357725.1 transglycosylase SLT domain-containing protein [Chitinivibrionales bacterium]